MISSFQNILNIAFYAAALQGIILSLFLANAKVNVISNQLLAVLTFCWAIILSAFALQSDGIFAKYPHLLRIVPHLVLLVMPLFYLSIKYLVISFDRFIRLDWIHFIPFFVSVLLYSKFYFLSAEEKLSIVQGSERYYYVVNFITNEMVTVQGLIYPILSLFLIKNYNKNLLNYQSNIDVSVITGMKAGTILMFIAWMIGAVDIHLAFFGLSIGVDLFIFVYIFIIVIIYVLSYVALKSPETYKLSTNQIKPIASENLHLLNKRDQIQIVETNSNDTESSVDDEISNLLLGYIKNKKPYLNPKLSLQDIADQLGYSRHQISSIINQQYGINFYEFINSYRVTEVKKLIEDSNNSDQKLISLAFDAGFNSKASFNRIFKQTVNKTPSEYRNNFGAK